MADTLSDLYSFSSTHMTAYHSWVDATCFWLLKNGCQKPLCTMASYASFAVVTDQELQRVDIWGTWKTHILMFVPRFSSIKPKNYKGLFLSNCELSAWRYHFGLICIFGRIVIGPVLSYRLLQKFWFSVLISRLSNRTRRTYLATSTLRTSNTGRESLLITEFR